MKRYVLIVYSLFILQAMGQPIFEYTPFDADEPLDYQTTESGSTVKGDCDLSTQIGAAPTAINTQPFLSITPPFRITLPGQYCLTIDVSVPAGADGIIIDTNNVVINLNDKCIKGQQGSRSGIFIQGINRSNITIKNGTIATMGFNGIQMANGGEQVFLQNLRLSRNNIGINVSGLRNFVIEGCNVVFNRSQGAVLSNFGTFPIQDGIVRDCIFGSNTLSGLQITQGRNIILHNVFCFDNSFNGILETNGFRIAFELCEANNNFQNGISSSGLGTSITQCIANNNGTLGNTLFSGFLLSGNRLNVNESIAKGNLGDGFCISGNNCTIANCSSKDNSQNGFKATGNQHSYEQCDSAGNTTGFQINNASHCLLNCLAKVNSTFGFLLQPSSTQCQVRSNTAVSNATAGFQNNTTTVNYIYSNFSSNNGTPPAAAANFVGIPNVFVSPVPGDPINFTTNISN